MATLKSIDLITNEMILKDLNYYRVYDSDGKSLLTSQASKDVTATEAVKILKEFLQNVEGIICITISASPSEDIAAGGKRGAVYKYTVKLGGNGNISGLETQSAINSPSANMNTVFNEMEAKFNARMEKLAADYEHKLEVEALKRELKELKENDSVKEMGMGLLAQYLQASGAVPGVSGFEKNPVPGIGGPDDNLERRQRLQNAINQISRIDKDYLEHLELIAKLATNNRLKYFGAIEKLKEL